MFETEKLAEKGAVEIPGLTLQEEKKKVGQKLLSFAAEKRRKTERVAALHSSWNP